MEYEEWLTENIDEHRRARFPENIPSINTFCYRQQPVIYNK